VAAIGLSALARPARRWGPALVAAALALTGALTARDYFVRFADPAVSAAPFDADVAHIATRLGAEAAGRQALGGPIEPHHPALRSLLPLREPPATFPVGATPLRPAAGRPISYFVRGRPDGEAARLVAAAYPSAAVDREADLTRFDVPAGAGPIAPAPSRPLMA